MQSPSPSVGAPGRDEPARPRDPRAPGLLTVSIVSHDQALLVDALLDQLATHTRAGLIRQVIVTVNIAEALPRRWEIDPGLPLTLIRNHEPAGFAANHNRALAAVDDGVVAIVNPDLQLVDDPFSLLAAAAAEPGAGLVVPRVLEADGRPADAARDLLTPGSILSRTLLGRRQISDRPAWFAGMCMALPASAWRRVGGFDERYRMYCEDFDLCARLRLAGLPLRRLEDAQVIHPARRSSHRSLQPLMWHLSSLIRVWRSPAYHAYRQLLRDEARLVAGSADSLHLPG